MRIKKFHPGGVLLPDTKLSAGRPITETELPMKVTVALNRHQDRPSKAVVKADDTVTRFQLIAEATCYISANIHAPISGTVKSIGPVEDAYGFQSESIVIEASEDLHKVDMERRCQRRSVDEIAALTPEDIRRICRESGLVGMGGATFPTDVKLTVPQGKNAEVLIVNGAECEPYLTCDHALMLAEPEEILRGIELARKACGAPKAIIGIEANKPDAIETLSSHASSNDRIEVATLKERYPQGGEKQLINALTGRHVPSGKLPIDAGAVVINVATAYALWRAVAYREPLVERVLTVTGPEVPSPANYRACIGQDITGLLRLSGINEIQRGSKLIVGGPMMGRAAANVNATVDKGTSGLLLLPPSMALRDEPVPCIRCARCVEACPMGLEPYLISTLCCLGKFDRAAGESLMDCIECGCCSYVCPSKRPLLDFIRLGKSSLRAKRNNNTKKTI